MKSLDSVGCRALEVGINIGLFEAAKNTPGTIEDLAKLCNVSPRGLRPLLFLLASTGAIVEQGDVYSTDSQLDGFLRDQWPSLEARSVPAKDWENLEKAVRTGNCVRTPIEGDEDAGQFFSGVVETLFGLHFSLAKSIAPELPDGPLEVLDLGAGSAVWSLGLAVQREQINVVAVDLEKVLDEVTSTFIERHGVSESYELRSGNYHNVELEQERYDVVYLGHIVHSEGWRNSIKLLERCRKTLKRDGTLVISEWVGSSPRGLDYHANLFDLNMLMFTEHGLVFDAAELEELSRLGGFNSLRWVKGSGKYPVLFAQT